MLQRSHAMEALAPELVPETTQKSLLRFLTCGSVDDGKSTLIGRLLFDTKLIFEDQMAALERLIARIKLVLGDAVKDVRASKRLKDSAVCLVADDGGMDLRLGRMLKGHEQFAGGTKPILEINAEHALVGRLRQMVDDPTATPDLHELAFLLLDQARIIEGEPVPDPGAFSRRMSRYLARGIEAA